MNVAIVLSLIQSILSAAPTIVEGVIHLIPGMLKNLIITMPVLNWTENMKKWLVLNVTSPTPIQIRAISCINLKISHAQVVINTCNTTVLHADMGTKKSSWERS